uniref:Uncharacterized protein n=1 Tax=Anguilla anguilla TaxID=7936 RepID=A0A0E9TAS9_ANGAN
MVQFSEEVTFLLSLSKANVLECCEHPEVATNFSCTSCACDKDS